MTPSGQVTARTRSPLMAAWAGLWVGASLCTAALPPPIELMTIVHAAIAACGVFLVLDALLPG